MMYVAKKLNLPALLTLILGLGLMSGAFAQRTAFAGRTDVVPAIQVTVPKVYSGKYLHVIYAVGRPGFLNVSPIPYLDIIRPQSQASLVNSEMVLFPSVEIEKTPGRGSYNLVVFTISNSPQINWVNVDVNPNPSDYSFLSVLQKPQIDSFIGQQGADKVLRINL